MRQAARRSRRLGIPWVADLRDPWALDEMMIYPTALHRARDAAMRALLASAAAIVMNTPEAARRLPSDASRRSRRTVVTIPNGFDAADFDARH